MIAADELHFIEIVDYLHDIFIKQTQNSVQKYFTHFYDVTSQYSSFTKLRQYVKNIVNKLPHIIFRAEDFIGLDKETLLYLVKRKDALSGTLNRSSAPSVELHSLQAGTNQSP